MKRDEVTHTADDAGRFEQRQAWVDVQDERAEGPATELTHAHGPGLICLKCAWLKARREHLTLVRGGADTDWCTRCDEEFDLPDGCLHGQVLCAHCKHLCTECRADLEYAVAEDAGRSS